MALSMNIDRRAPSRIRRLLPLLAALATALASPSALAAGATPGPGGSTATSVASSPVGRAPASAATSGPAVRGPATPTAGPRLGCLIEAERVAEVGSPTPAVVKEIHVERGQMVRKGQVLATLQSGVERAALDLASHRAQGQADQEAAATQATFTRDRAQRAEELFAQGFISQQALNQSRTEARVAEQQLARAREQSIAARYEQGLAAAQLSQRVIRSPIDGVVAERYLTVGERVEERPIVRIARIDRLKVLLVVPSSMYREVREGSQVGIWPDLPGSTRLAATVVNVDRVIDPGSNTFRVQAELPNADLTLPAGLRCRGELSPIDAPPAAPKAPTMDGARATPLPMDPRGLPVAMRTDQAQDAQARR